MRDVKYLSNISSVKMLFVVETQFTGLSLFCSVDLFPMFLCVKLCYGPIMLDTHLTTHGNLRTR